MLVHAPTRTVAIKAVDPLHVRDLLPKSKLLDHPDYNIQIKHTVESTRVLRNIGFEVPAPIQSEYKWPGKYTPFAHQKVMADFLTMNRRCFNLSEMGVGKSAAALWAADWLMATGRVKKCVILSPLSTLDRVWAHDIFDVLMHRKAVVVHGNREQRERAMKADVDFYIVNHDGVTIPWLHKKIATDPRIDLIIVDEAGMFRNGSTTKYKMLEKMIRPDQRLWLLTGTPCPNAPTDAWALAKLVAPDKVPKFFGHFQRMTMLKVSQYKWEAKKDAYATAFSVMQPAIRFRKADCLDLPQMTFQDRQCNMSAAQNKAYKEMKTMAMMEAKQGVQITAVNAADRIGKIRQILCGSVKDPKSEKYITIDHGPRFEVLRECIEAAAAKVIVIVPFKGIIMSLQQEIEKAGKSCAILNGDISPKARDTIVRLFKERKDPHVLVCHPKVMAHGLNLTEADTLIFYAPIYSNDEFQQVIERFNRTGQKNKMTVVRMAAHPIEWQIYKLVDNRRAGQDSILKLYKSIIE